MEWQIYLSWNESNQIGYVFVKEDTQVITLYDGKGNLVLADFIN